MDCFERATCLRLIRTDTPLKSQRLWQHSCRHREEEVDTRSQPSRRNHLQLIPTGKGKVSFPWNVTGYIKHTPGVPHAQKELANIKGI